MQPKSISFEPTQISFPSTLSCLINSFILNKNSPKHRMVKKMKLPSLLKNTNVRSSPSWAWPYCHQPKTLSFRANNDVVFKTINSAYLDAAEESPESFFTESPVSASFSTASEEDSRDLIETVITHGLRSDRLFFEPDETSSIVEAKAYSGTFFPFKDSAVVLSMDSRDPYVDFKKSMEEMVESHGVNDWEGLEELLCWYLKVNGKINHGYIVSAFVDLLVGLAFASATTTTGSSSPSSPLSFDSSSSCSTRCVSCLEGEQVELDDAPYSYSPSLLEQVKEEITVLEDSSSSSSNA